jgi:hypothetical protein
MNRQFQLVGVLNFLLICYAPLGFAQDEEPNKETEPENTNVPAGQEVEINEDNYRQFMELKDSRGQRNMLPENAFKPGSGAQKLDKLPEESQKHLRNQLREIIVQGDPWQPGDENTQYPYVPSNAASANPSLEKQEAEAWGELVENYHQREAEIYENSARSQAAMATGASSGSGPGNSEGSRGGNAGQGGEGQESSQPSQGEQSSAAGSYSPNAQNDPNATSTEGVSQNAMEFLTGKSGQVAKAGETNNGAGESAQNDNQGESQAQQGSQKQAQSGSNSADSATASATAEVESQSTTGASQNALEYLTGGQEQTTQATGDSPGTDEGMPLPELPSLREQVPANMEGTLTIQDLINAQGVRTVTGTGETVPVDDPDKEGDG